MGLAGQVFSAAFLRYSRYAAANASTKVCGRWSADKEQYWELFTTFYRNLIEMPADHLPHTFVEAFAAAYREYLKKAAEKS